jgi:2-polyprenyl-6-methoxyphenol hydroxylase-like FAD-dependent oxidoreductase
MCGIALKRAGHAVTILEKEDNVRQSHMAGVCLGLDGERFLARHDRLHTVFTHRSVRVQSLFRDGTLKVFLNAIRVITSWDTYYFRLRANFDGYTSSFYPKAPLPSQDDGPAEYKALHQVTSLSRRRITASGEDGRGSSNRDTVVLDVLDKTTGTTSQLEADYVVGADGPDSFIRSKYLPTSKRRYVGYIAWRGTVPESEVSQATRDIFRDSVTVHMMDRQHCIMYMIPGRDGSLKVGERHLNFLWYTNEDPAALDEILRDSVDGHRHYNIVPSGRVRKDIWEARREEARRIPLAEPFLEVMLKIEKPFIQVITEFVSPRACFEDGKVLLVADGLSLYRPHTAFSGTQAAFGALRIEELIAGKTTPQDWENKMLLYARIHSAQATALGRYYQSRSRLSFVWSSLWFHWYCAVDRIRAWWRGEERLLRLVQFAKKPEDVVRD